ncbi:16S rRNA (cytosine(1402)-N(4))-methyltransferase RsmH [bacterium]|nr:16S rRNA (cytosine(1402)-N(4))-methyltransferase RsmH [bacterium]
MQRLHKSVLLAECLEALAIRPGGKYADMTFGEGGHSEAILEAGAGLVVGVDRDSETLDDYRESGTYRTDPRLELHHTTLEEFAAQSDGQKFDGILADLGVSTRQLLTAERGFSLQADGPLDMRMDRTQETSLEDYLAHVKLEDLASDLKRVADLQQARGMARKILNAREKGTLRRTSDLARVAGGAWSKVHPATPVFLALRMIVNREFDQVETGLPQLFERLVPGGRLAVITFHSTEDRLVKRLFATLAGRCVCAHTPCECPRVERGKLLTPKPIAPSEAELEANPRSRSAKLRCIEKLAVTA